MPEVESVDLPPQVDNLPIVTASSEDNASTSENNTATSENNATIIDHNSAAEVLIQNVVGFIDSIRKTGKGQYLENVLKIVRENGWSDLQTNEAIEIAIKAGKIKQVTSNNKVSYRITKGVSIADGVENV